MTDSSNDSPSLSVRRQVHLVRVAELFAVQDSLSVAIMELLSEIRRFNGVTATGINLQVSNLNLPNDNFCVNTLPPDTTTDSYIISWCDDKTATGPKTDCAKPLFNASALDSASFAFKTITNARSVVACNNIDDSIASLTQPSDLKSTMMTIREADFNSIAVIQLHLEDVPLGHLWLCDTRTDCFDPDMLSYCSLLGTCISNSLYLFTRVLASRANELRYDAVFENAPQLIVSCEKEKTVLRCSRQASKLLGYGPKDIVGQPFTNFIHAEDQQPIQKLISQIGTKKTEESLEFRIEHQDGSLRYVVAHFSEFVSRDDIQPNALCLMEDITKRTTAIRALEQSETSLREAQKLANIGSWEWNLQTNIVSVSEQMKTIWQLTSLQPELDEVLSKIHSEDLARVSKALQRATDVGSAYDEEFRILHNGEQRVIRGQGKVIKKNGNPILMVGTGEDITQKKQAEEKLRYHAELLNHLSDAVVSTDERFVVLSWNKRADSMYGYTDQEAIGKISTDLVRPIHISESREEALAQLFNNGFWRGEMIHHHKDGRRIQVMSSVALIKDNKGNVTGAVAINRDIGEQKRIEAQLTQKDRLASLGLLAAGIAHEINNPLTYILYKIESLADTLEANDHNLAKNVQQALDEAYRIRDLVKDLNTFSRVKNNHVTDVDINEVLNTAINIARTTVKHRTQIEKDFSPIPRIKANDGKLTQVFLNLIVNADHAFGDDTVENQRIFVRTRKKENKIQIDISDNGSGIDPKHLSHLFDPFFSTKEVGHGSGLGLSICRNIVLQHQGSIDVKSQLGKGSCFSVVLPSTEDAPSENVVSTKITNAQPTNRRGRILIVDDEPLVAHVLEETLMPHHDVEVVNSVKTAKQTITENCNFDCIICDLMMPVETGMDLYYWMGKDYSNLAKRIIFISGGTFTEESQSFFSQVQNQKIAKPFRAMHIIEAVRNIMMVDDSAI